MLMFTSLQQQEQHHVSVYANVKLHRRFSQLFAGYPLGSPEPGSSKVGSEHKDCQAPSQLFHLVS